MHDLVTWLAIVTHHNGRFGGYLENTAMKAFGRFRILIMVTSLNFAFDSDYCG